MLYPLSYGGNDGNYSTASPARRKTPDRWCDSPTPHPDLLLSSTVTPAELASIITATTRTVLTDHGLDADVVPEQATVERPRNPEHGDYATNIALQTAKKAGTPVNSGPGSPRPSQQSTASTRPASPGPAS